VLGNLAPRRHDRFIPCLSNACAHAAFFTAG
jgi:hypothetical protein